MPVERLLYLVRHGETTGESSIRYHGRTDVPLSDLGRQQMRALAPLLAEVQLETLVHSPLSRARESAVILLEALRKPPTRVVEEHALSEVDFGAIEGMTEPEIHAALPEWHAQWKAGAVAGYPGGETILGFARRVARSCDGLLQEHCAGNLLVVAHRGVIKRMLGHWLALAEPAVRALPIDLASLTVVRCADGFELVQLNARAPQ